MCDGKLSARGVSKIRRVGKEAKMKSAKPRRVDGQIKNENGKKELHRKKVRQRTNGDGTVKGSGRIPGQAVARWGERERILYRLNSR